MRISYGWGSDGFFRFYENSDVVTSPQTATSTKKETSDSRSTQNRITDALLPGSGPILSRQDEDKPSFILVVLATSTACLGFVLLSTLIGFCCLWNKKNATEMGTYSQPNPGRGEHFEGREPYCICQNQEHHATVSF
ncbi:uncharacterized protein LOC128206808 [Mya arenaria]|uniref:uncharacterized protein LOC128206808 n=1 Tax=Mya arenaria TaxID=6604 RepID=UPI0022E896EB|nr:uncharacterized protein LOC128206808 [Mya arenaria]